MKKIFLGLSLVTSIVLAQVTTAGTATAQTCHPLTNHGNCYQSGEFCRGSDHGATGVDGDGRPMACVNNDGWRWEG